MSRQELADKLKQEEAEEHGHPIERHYRVPYVADRLGLSRAAVRNAFRDHPAVKVIERPGSSTKRVHNTLLIPESALREFGARRAS